MANNFDPADARAVIGESPLNAYTVADTANGESLADAAALHFDDDAFKILEPFAVSFNDLNVYANGVTDFELGKIGTKLLFFEFSDDVLHSNLLIYRCS